MPKPEERKPWATSKAAAIEPYPRKNLYFVGDYMDEVYDYCIWRANVDGYIRLDGSAARGSSEFIIDQLTRLYLRTMLDPEKAAAFADWRRRQYAEAGQDPELARVHPSGIALSKNLQGGELSGEFIYDPTSDTFVRPPLKRRRRSTLNPGKTKKRTARGR